MNAAIRTYLAANDLGFSFTWHQQRHAGTDLPFIWHQQRHAGTDLPFIWHQQRHAGTDLPFIWHQQGMPGTDFPFTRAIVAFDRPTAWSSRAFRKMGLVADHLHPENRSFSGEDQSLCYGVSLTPAAGFWIVTQNVDDFEESNIALFNADSTTNATLTTQGVALRVLVLTRAFPPPRAWLRDRIHEAESYRLS